MFVCNTTRLWQFPGHVRYASNSDQICAQQRTVAKCQKATFPLSALRRALGDDVDDLKRHHYFAGLIDYLDERGDRAAIGL